MKPRKRPAKRGRRPGPSTKWRTNGTAVVWALGGICARYGVSKPTAHRWEAAGWLPPRDVFVGNRAIGWRPETLDAADRGGLRPSGTRKDIGKNAGFRDKDAR